MIQDHTFKANNPAITTITTKPIIITKDSPTIIQVETPIVVAVTPTTTQINDATFPLGGRLSKFHNQWKEFGVSALILDWIQHGVPIESDSDHWKNYHQRKFSMIEKNWIQKEIGSMLKEGVIVHSQDVITNPINVVPKKGTDQFRFILDLRKVNDGISVDPFRMESVQKIMKFLRKGMWACKIDLKKGYFHVPIRQKDRRLLGFIFNGELYQFTCLPFGLSTAPRSFTKIMKEIVKKWRLQGLIIFIYIDDILLVGDSFIIVLENLNKIVSVLEFLGCLIHS